jgi:hypothetical protein
VVIPETDRNRIPIRCPLHEDRNPSAVLFRDENVFFCSVCTPNGGLSAKQFAREVSVDWARFREDLNRLRPAWRTSVRPAPSTTFKLVEGNGFTSRNASDVWSLARGRARDDDQCGADHAVYNYLASRGLAESWEQGAFGVLAEDMRLPEPVSWWPSAGYRLVVPLYDSHGEIAAVQARTISGGNPKTRFPKGCRVRGTVFASRVGLELLSGTCDRSRTGLLAEGLTDFLALGTYCAEAVLSAPGTGLAQSVVGEWVRGRTLLVALDLDTAGQAPVEELARSAFARGCRRVVRLAWPNSAHDACEALSSLGAAPFEEFLERECERWRDA